MLVKEDTGISIEGMKDRGYLVPSTRPPKWEIRHAEQTPPKSHKKQPKLDKLERPFWEYPPQ